MIQQPQQTPNVSDEQQKKEELAQTLEQEKIEDDLLQKIVEYKNLALRATADYRNLQRETDEKLAAMRKYATEELLKELCPVVDYFDSAFAAIPEEHKQEGWVQGVQHIYDYVLQILRHHGIERQLTVGQRFDPSLHESVGEEESDAAEHTIVRELQAGFSMNGKVIRPAKVILAKSQQGNASVQRSTIQENQNQNKQELTHH